MILKTFIFWRLCLFILAFIGFLTFNLQINGALKLNSHDIFFNYWHSWAQWDGGHYLQIAKYDYQNMADAAFFPLYPEAIKLLSPIFLGNYLLTGLLISNISFLAFLYTLERLFRILSGDKSASNIIFLYILFPASFFAVAFYSEGLYLFLSTAALLFFVKKSFDKSYFFAALSSIARPFGIILIFSLYVSQLFHVFKNKEKLTKLFDPTVKASLSLLPFVIYVLFLKAIYHDSLAFFSVQSDWNRIIVDPLTTFGVYLKSLVTFKLPNLMDYIDLLTFVSFITILILGIRKLITPIWIYSMLVIVFCAMTGTLSGIPRYSLSAIGVFILLANYLKGKETAKLVIFIIFLVLQILLLVRFFNGYWVA